MAYRLAADALVLLHFAFVLFVLFGGLLVMRWPRLAWLHLPAVAWGIGISLAGAVCPLTPWENVLREAAGEGVYAGTFVERYIMPILYPVGLTHLGQVALAVIVVGVNGAVYALAWRRRGD